MLHRTDCHRQSARSASMQPMGSGSESRPSKCTRSTSTVSLGMSTIGSDLIGSSSISGLSGGKAGSMVTDSTSSGALGQNDADAASPSVVEIIQKLPQDQLAQIFLDINDAITITRAQNGGVDYRHISLAIHDILIKKVSTERTTSHADGPRSAEKEHAHQKRDSNLSKQLAKFENYDEGKIRRTKQLYCRLKSAYRAPTDAGVVELEDTRIITKDSNLLVYETSTSINLPVGYHWKTFKKQDLMDQHQLPTSVHLLLLGILITNDYTNGVPFYGLMLNAGIVRTFDLEGTRGSERPRMTSSIQTLRRSLLEYRTRQGHEGQGDLHQKQGEEKGTEP
ncbi:hypothetical protein BG015_007416 [Linnemannia schmuckeri]|uniref:Uncharacterized protein n=1 Tax=Linnemannia schmuckeri TaxID=64567 RepID=A0A9P5S232_9FUNG|nr:hypothetical protein BG015_007416 [Linnemannia schmuckeri]